MGKDVVIFLPGLMFHSLTILTQGGIYLNYFMALDKQIVYSPQAN